MAHIVSIRRKTFSDDQYLHHYIKKTKNIRTSVSVVVSVMNLVRWKHVSITTLLRDQDN